MVSNNDSRKIMSEINITPFTDVVLVLLIIFMVTAPLMMQAGIPVKLPKASAVADTSDAGLTITITKDGKVYFNDVEVDKSHLENSMKNRILNDPNLLVIIKADTHTYHGDVVEVLDMAKSVGVKRLAVATEAKSAVAGRKEER